MTFSVCKKMAAVILGAVLLVFSQGVFAENCNVPLNNSNLSCSQKWDLYNYRHNAQAFLNFQGAMLSMEIDNTDSKLAVQQATVDMIYSSVDIISMTKNAVTADTLVKDIATLDEVQSSVMSAYIDTVGGEYKDYVQIALTSSGCMYDAIDNFKLGGLVSASGGAAYCVSQQIVSSWYNLKALFSFDSIAERYNSLETAKKYLSECYENGSCTRNPSDVANSLGFTNTSSWRWWRVEYDEAYLNTLISNVKNSVSNKTRIRMSSNNNYSTPILLSESQLPKLIPLPATPPTGTAPQPIVGTRTDLTPDFDVFDNATGKEVSANCNACSTKPLNPNQSIRARLTTQTINANASGFKRDSSSKSIEGFIWWKIEGKTDWAMLGGLNLEYTISNLVKGGESNETYDNWLVPNYVGDVLAMKACVDGDDEIYEEGEGGRIKITNPDQSGTSNNCSRTERFFIVPITTQPVYCQPPLVNDLNNNQQCVAPLPAQCTPPLINDPNNNQKCITPPPSPAQISAVLEVINTLLLDDEPCVYTLAPATKATTTAGGAFTATTTTAAECGWNLSSNKTWLTFTSAATGKGNNTLNYSVAANPTYAARAGVITLTSATDATVKKTLTVRQAPKLGISIAQTSVTEGAAGAAKEMVFTVKLNQAATKTVNVNYSTAKATAVAGAVFTATSGTLSFLAGQTVKTVSVPIIGDAVVEPNETFWLLLSAPTAPYALQFSRAAGTILNDD